MNLPQKRILVIEDEDSHRDLISQLLTFQGYEVLSAASGKEALASLVKNKIDLILLDIALPDASGIALMKQIRAKKPFATLPIIVVSAHVHPTDIRAAFAAGATSHIPKPINIQKLLQDIAAYLNVENESS